MLVVLGWQPAVSPIGNRQAVAIILAPSGSGRPQAASPAKQSRRGGTNLRYDFVTRSEMCQRLRIVWVAPVQKENIIIILPK